MYVWIDGWLFRWKRQRWKVVTLRVYLFSLACSNWAIVALTSNFSTYAHTLRQNHFYFLFFLFLFFVHPFVIEHFWLCWNALLPHAYPHIYVATTVGFTTDIFCCCCCCSCCRCCCIAFIQVQRKLNPQINRSCCTVTLFDCCLRLCHIYLISLLPCDPFTELKLFALLAWLVAPCCCSCCLSIWSLDNFYFSYFSL